MRVERLLANLGYATRKDCQAMIKKGRVLGAGGARLKVRQAHPITHRLPNTHPPCIHMFDMGM